MIKCHPNWAVKDWKSPSWRKTSENNRQILETKKARWRDCKKSLKSRSGKSSSCQMTVKWKTIKLVILKSKLNTLDTRSFICSFVQSFVCLFVRLLLCSFASFFVRCSFFHLFVFPSVRSFVRSFFRLFVRLYVRSFVRSFFHFFIRSFVCFFFVRSFICSFVRSCVRSLVSSFVLSFVLLFVRRLMLSFLKLKNFELFPGFSEVRISLKPTLRPLLLVFFTL